MTANPGMKLEQMPSDDRSLILKSQQGDKRAFGALVDKYMRRAYFVALGFVGSHESALDMSQEAFVRAYSAMKRFEADRNFFTWYYRILRNLCLNFIRDRNQRAHAFSEVGEERVARVPDASLDAEAVLERQETREMVWRALNELKPEEREIILLKDFQDFSYKEIAESLEIPMGTVMSRLYYARRSLKNKIEKVLR